MHYLEEELQGGWGCRGGMEGQDSIFALYMDFHVNTTEILIWGKLAKGFYELDFAVLDPDKYSALSERLHTY